MHLDRMYLLFHIVPNCYSIVIAIVIKYQISNLSEIISQIEIQKRMAQRIYSESDWWMWAIFINFISTIFHEKEKSQERSLEMERCYKYFFNIYFEIYIQLFACSITHRFVRKSYFILKYLDIRIMTYSNNKIK